MAAPEIHTITRIGANGNYSTGGTDIGPHRGGGGGSCSWNEITGKPNFARVATTGSYNDLSNKPSIPAAYDDSALKARVTALEQSGGSGTSYDDTAIKARMTAAENKLNGLAAVATSGSYNDLSNKPTIPAAYNDTALINRVTALENKTDQDTKPVLVSALTVNNAMGQATAGKTYPVGTSVEAILRDILTTGSTPTPTTYTITFNANGGSVTPTSATTGTDGKLASLPTPTHATDTFKGWFTAATGGTAVTTNTVFMSNDTIYAQWQAVTESYTIFATSTNLDTLDEIAVEKSAGEYVVPLCAQLEERPAYFDVPNTLTNQQLFVYNPLLQTWQTSRDHASSSVTHEIDGQTVQYTTSSYPPSCSQSAATSFSCTASPATWPDASTALVCFS